MALGWIAPAVQGIAGIFGSSKAKKAAKQQAAQQAYYAKLLQGKADEQANQLKGVQQGYQQYGQQYPQQFNQAAMASPYYGMNTRPLAQAQMQQALQDPQEDAMRRFQLAQAMRGEQTDDIAKSLANQHIGRFSGGGVSGGSGATRALAERAVRDHTRQGDIANLGSVNAAYDARNQALQQAMGSAYQGAGLGLQATQGAAQSQLQGLQGQQSAIGQAFQGQMGSLGGAAGLASQSAEASGLASMMPWQAVSNLAGGFQNYQNQQNQNRLYDQYISRLSNSMKQG